MYATFQGCTSLYDRYSGYTVSITERCISNSVSVRRWRVVASICIGNRDYKKLTKPTFACPTSKEAFNSEARNVIGGMFIHCLQTFISVAFKPHQ